MPPFLNLRRLDTLRPLVVLLVLVSLCLVLVQRLSLERSAAHAEAEADTDNRQLPPLGRRPPIYTYVDLSQHRNEPSDEVEHALLHTWARAWFAQGFEPIALSSSNAVKHPLYPVIKHRHLHDSVRSGLLLWLAWDTVDTGILCSSRVLPMAVSQPVDSFLSFLRAGNYSTLSRYDGLDAAFMLGSKAAVHAAVQAAVQSPALEQATHFDALLPRSAFHFNVQPDSIAYYSDQTIMKQYNVVGDLLANTTTKRQGLSLLPALVNSHLHLTWQTSFPHGVAVLDPIPEHSAAITEAAVAIAVNLTECAWSPMLSSCPPNQPTCKPCVSNHLSLSTLPAYRYRTGLFTIGTVPHPYTMQALIHNNASMDVAYIRRKTDRDVWLHAATKELTGVKGGLHARLPRLEQAISEHAATTSLWFTAEQALSWDTEKNREEIDWVLGFRLPRPVMASGKSKTPVPGLEREPQLGLSRRVRLSKAQLEEERGVLLKASSFVRQRKTSAAVHTIAAVEAWNLGDVEAWRFVQGSTTQRNRELASYRLGKRWLNP